MTGSLLTQKPNRTMLDKVRRIAARHPYPGRAAMPLPGSSRGKLPSPGIINFSRRVRGDHFAALVAKLRFYPDSVRVLRVTGPDSGDLDPITDAVGNPEKLWQSREVGLNPLQPQDCLASRGLRYFHVRLTYRVGFQNTADHRVMRSVQRWPGKDCHGQKGPSC
jgi:hypothetical protein